MMRQQDLNDIVKSIAERDKEIARLRAEVEALRTERTAFIDAVRWLPARITDQLREYKPVTMQIIDAAMAREEG